MALGALLLTLAGLGAYFGSRPSPGGAFELLGGFDVSTSQDGDEKTRNSGIFNSLIEQALPPQSNVVLWEYDRKARKRYEGMPESAGDLLPFEEEYIRHAPETKGTYQGVVMEEMLASARAAASKGRGVGMVLLTDGEDFDAARTLRVCRQLAEIGALKAVWVVPVETTENYRGQSEVIRSTIERSLEPLGDRVIISSRLDIRDGLRRFKGKIDAD